MYNVVWNTRGRRMYEGFPKWDSLGHDLRKIKEVLCGTFYCYVHGDKIFSTMVARGGSTLVGRIERAD